MSQSIKKSSSSKALRKNKRIATESNELIIERRRSNFIHVSLKIPQAKPFTFEVPKGIENSTLKKQLTKVYAHVYPKKPFPIGFSSGNNPFDYQLHLGLGKLQNNLVLRPFEQEKDKSGLEKYEICTCLAIGGFSKVFLVRSKITGDFHAAKFIEKKSDVTPKILENQKKISQKLQYPFVVKTSEFIQTQKFYIFIMEYCPGGELFYLLKKIKFMDESEARSCFIEILLGINYIHSLGYMYRDLKPENILIDAYGHIKIADFGLAKDSSKKSYSFCGSIEYMAPEIIRGKGHNQFVDYYCLGALLFEMLVGYPPFYSPGLTPAQTRDRIIYDDVCFPIDADLSKEVKDFILKLMDKNEKKRLGYFGGMKEILAHPWVQKVDKQKYQDKNIIPPFPVDLSQLNFDPDQIGNSERIFREKIDRQVETLCKNHQKKHQSQKNLTRHFKSTSQSKSLKKGQSPFLELNRNSVRKVYQKSPYAREIRKSKQIVTEANEQSSILLKTKKYALNHRMTQIFKQNNFNQSKSKIKKKGKFSILNNHHLTFGENGNKANDNLSYLEKIGKKNKELNSIMGKMK